MYRSRWADPEGQAPSPAPVPAPVPAPAPPAVESAPPGPPSAAATYAYDDDVDEFAQTRGADDLFDDEFVPIAEPIEEPPPPIEEHPPVSPTAIPTGPSNVSYVGRGGRAARGSRRGGRSSPPPGEGATHNGDAEGGQVQPAREAAVRGDRSGTGGVKKAKLSEDELNSLLSKMSLKNASLTDAHARAEADAASFEAREATAQAAAVQRMREDRQNRQQMMGEREKNRLRKMKALEGREWDAEKEQGFEGVGDVRVRGAKRGAYGGVSGSRHAYQPPAPDAADDDADLGARDASSYNVRGRGRGRGRGGRGLGRGGRGDGDARQSSGSQQHPPIASDFPDLPAAKAALSRSDDNKPPTPLEFPVKPSKEASIPTLAHEDGAGEVPAEPTPPASRAQGKKKGAAGVPPKQQESFGLGPASPAADGGKKSWADQVEGAAGS